VIARVAGWLFGINPLTLLGLLGGGELAPPVAEAPATAPPPGDTQAAFVSTVLADTEDVWGALMRAGGAAHCEPKLVRFRDATRSACGVGQSAMGPFDCPADEAIVPHRRCERRLELQPAELRHERARHRALRATHEAVNPRSTPLLRLNSA
jgi:predicted metalloprotease